MRIRISIGTETHPTAACVLYHPILQTKEGQSHTRSTDIRHVLTYVHSQRRPITAPPCPMRPPHLSPNVPPAQQKARGRRNGKFIGLGPKMARTQQRRLKRAHQQRKPHLSTRQQRKLPNGPTARNTIHNRTQCTTTPWRAANVCARRMRRRPMSCRFPNARA